MEKKENIKPIAIHGNGDKDMGLKWIEYCKENSIPYKIVNCFSNKIIDDLKDCSSLMLHVNTGSHELMLFGKQILFTLQSQGMKTFPDFNTLWHYDDKVGQKYLLEQINAPLVNTYVFYSERDALSWINTTTFPKVFKLRNGASSSNVRLIKTREEAKKIIKKAFSSGFSHRVNDLELLKERWRKYRLRKSNLGGVKYAIKRLLGLKNEVKFNAIEFGYVYFQDFIPNNEFDIRITVIDKKVFGIKRLVRKNDFRASGSGLMYFEKENFDFDTIKLSLEIAKKLKAQSIAFDFVYLNNRPYLVEASYCWTVDGEKECPGYWDEHLIWHEGPFNPYGWMVEALRKTLVKQN